MNASSICPRPVASSFVSFALCAIFGGLVAACLPAQTSEDSAATKSVGWRKRPIPADRFWKGYTHTEVVGRNAYFLHGRDVEILAPDGSWTHLDNILPRRVDAFSAIALVRKFLIAVVPGRNETAFVLDPRTKECVDLTGFNVRTGRGSCLLYEPGRGLLCLVGGGSRDFLCYDGNGKLTKLPQVASVNAPGKYSSALLRMGSKLLTFGDHHVASMTRETMTWDGQTKVWKLLGFRPALDRGGMVYQDLRTEKVFMTHGMGSRNIAIMLLHGTRRHFHYLSPRLPVGLRDPGRTLFVTRNSSGRPILNVLSQEHRAVFWVPLHELVMVRQRDRGPKDYRDVDPGSRWMSWSSFNTNFQGDLIRQRDGTANLLFLDPFVVIQRKTLLRTVQYDTWRWSRWAGAPVVGTHFATKGSAICTDGRKVYAINGYSTDFYSVDLFLGEDGKPSETMLAINDAQATKLARYDPFPAGTAFDERPRNADLAYHKGMIYALSDPLTRMLHRYDPGKNEWSPQMHIPTEIKYSNGLGMDLLVVEDKLTLLSGNGFASYEPGKGWSDVTTLDFSYTADGGMAVYDPVEKLIYVVIGAGTRGMGVINPATGDNVLLEEFMPDAVSVYGRRIFLSERGGHRYLNVHRGHDSSEFFRTEISGKGRLSAR